LLPSDGVGGIMSRMQIRGNVLTIVALTLFAPSGFAQTPADRVVDARGLTLAPGFIDTHSHHDRGIFDHRDALAAVSQGVTTIVFGQDAGSSLSLASFFARIDTE
jgi:N-acyl-D-amino-acid deacylase